MPDQPTPTPATPPIEIAVRGLWKSFGSRAVLRNITLTVRRHELVAVVGPSGCGKTVLLKHITGHLRPDRGHIFAADHETPGSPLREIGAFSDEQLERFRVHSAVVFQRNALLTGTVFDNLALSLREVRRMPDDEILPLAREALSAVGLDPDEVLTRRRDDLSGGMAKRVAIARALVMDPALIIYDEPTAGLDPHYAAQIHELIRSTHDRPSRAGLARTTLIVTHDTELLRRLEPRVIMLHEGAVLFDGPFPGFRDSSEEAIRPYFAQMPVLHASAHRPLSEHEGD
ncbi:MAG: ATP-binding cassette domain-containing protein [Phycisphaeraceae bacterium]|nr:ATP-binding cassette domain-containing protein [Phycisphaeraceae bacterium]